MFKIIKFFFWMVCCVIVAYFLTDIKIGGVTLKQMIDDFIAKPSVQEVKDKSQKYLEDKLEEEFNSKAMDRVIRKASEEVIKEVITEKDEQKLEDVIREN